MKKYKRSLKELLSLAAITGNILFGVWILYNGIHERFSGTILEKISYISLLGLLAVNAFLLIHNNRQQNKNV